jgi:hypothetical protein
MEVKMTGTPDKIREQMGIVEEGNGNRPRGASEIGTPDDFTKAIQNPKYQVVVKRITPRVWEDRRANVEVFRESCPLDMDTIQEEVFSHHGGRRFRVAVVDLENNTTVAARIIDNDADPIFPDAGKFDEAAALLMREAEPSAQQKTLDTIRHEVEQTQAQLELERLTQQLDELKDRRKTGAAKPNGELETRIAEMEKRIVEVKHQNEVAALRERLTDMEKRLTNPPSTPPPADNGLKELLKVMQDHIAASEKKFDRLMDQMRDDKLASIERAIEGLKNRPQQEGNSLRESIQTVKDIAEMLGLNLPGSGDEDDKEPKEWYEILLDKYVPKIFDLIEDRKKEGKTVTKEELVSELNAAADKAAADAVARARAKLVAPPAPTGGTALPPPPPTSGTVPTPVERKIPSVEDEVKLRAASVMAVVERESTLRPRDYQWNYLAWRSLPEDILARLCAAPDPAGLLTVFDGLVNPEALAAMKSRVAADPKLSAWIGRGIVELRDWWKKAETDPDFDPADEDEDGEED